MKFKEIFDKAVLVEGHVRKGLKIFYEIDLNLIKPKDEEQKPEDNQTQPPATALAPESNIPVPGTTTPGENNVPAPENNTPAPEASSQEPQASSQPNLSGLMASVQTEEEAAENTDEKIMRHFQGEYTCKSEQADNIQTFEDIVNILADTKKNGINILDDFCKEIIILCANQKYDEIKNKLDKKSKIFAEIYLGYKKDDSVGVRFKKSENSDSLSSSILIDNQIVTLTKFNIDKVNQKIIEYRNYEAEKS